MCKFHHNHHHSVGILDSTGKLPKLIIGRSDDDKLFYNKNGSNLGSVSSLNQLTIQHFPLGLVSKKQPTFSKMSNDDKYLDVQ